LYHTPHSQGTFRCSSSPAQTTTRNELGAQLGSGHLLSTVSTPILQHSRRNDDSANQQPSLIPNGKAPDLKYTSPLSGHQEPLCSRVRQSRRLSGDCIGLGAHSIRLSAAHGTFDSYVMNRLRWWMWCRFTVVPKSHDCNTVYNYPYKY
jgi:hypothetical protein